MAQRQSTCEAHPLAARESMVVEMNLLEAFLYPVAIIGGIGVGIMVLIVVLYIGVTTIDDIDSARFWRRLKAFKKK